MLVEKSLIKIDRFDQVTSHNLIQDMGTEIVCQESPKSPGERSRLWHLEDIVQIFGKNMVSKTNMNSLVFPLSLHLSLLSFGLYVYYFFKKLFS